MFRTDLLRECIAASGLTLREVARGLNMTPRTLYDRLKKGVFRSDEMERLIGMLHMANPCEVFFDIRTL